MIKFVFIILLFSLSAFAYVPTVESLFRNGANPDVTVNGAMINLVVRKPGVVQEATDASSENKKSEDFYKIFFTRATGDSLKIAQTRYSNSSYSESSLLEKVYFASFSPYTMKSTPEEIEKGLWIALLQSMIFNNGSHLVNYLKTLAVPVRLNNELINRDKVELLASYKQYLAITNKDRTAKIANPLRPEDPAEKEKVERVMSEPMYIDTNQVKLSREGGEAAWLVSAAPFEGIVSYKDRDIHAIRFKSNAGEFEITCKNFWLANGTHRMPRNLTIKNVKGETFEIEITNLRQYQEKEEDLVRRLKNWDQILKGRQSKEPKPDFLL